MEFQDNLQEVPAAPAQTETPAAAKPLIETLKQKYEVEKVGPLGECILIPYKQCDAAMFTALKDEGYRVVFQPFNGVVYAHVQLKKQVPPSTPTNNATPPPNRICPDCNRQLNEPRDGRRECHTDGCNVIAVLPDGKVIRESTVTVDFRDLYARKPEPEYTQPDQPESPPENAAAALKEGAIAPAAQPERFEHGAKAKTTEPPAKTPTCEEPTASLVNIRKAWDPAYRYQPDEDKMLIALWNQKPPLSVAEVCGQFRAKYPARTESSVKNRIAKLQQKKKIKPHKRGERGATKETPKNAAEIATQPEPAPATAQPATQPETATAESPPMTEALTPEEPEQTGRQRSRLNLKYGGPVWDDEKLIEAWNRKTNGGKTQLKSLPKLAEEIQKQNFPERTPNAVYVRLWQLTKKQLLTAKLKPSNRHRIRRRTPIHAPVKSEKPRVKQNDAVIQLEAETADKAQLSGILQGMLTEAVEAFKLEYATAEELSRQLGDAVEALGKVEKALAESAQLTEILWEMVNDATDVFREQRQTIEEQQERVKLLEGDAEKTRTHTELVLDKLECAAIMHALEAKAQAEGWQLPPTIKQLYARAIMRSETGEFRDRAKALLEAC